MKQVKRVLFTGTGSGSGKTTLTCGILQCLIRRGITPSAFKCGPDYIDPMFHQKVLGVPSGNLDGFFCNEQTIKYLLTEHTGEDRVAVIEGVMGYYDGIGMTEEASSAYIAELTDTPVILIVNCRGMAASVKALLKGYVEYEPEGRRHIRGVIFNMLPESLYPSAAAYAVALGLKPLGFVPQKKELFFESRHLGLVTPEEITEFKEKLEHLADLLEKTVDIEGILALAGTAPPLCCEDLWKDYRQPKCPPRIAVARDEAFCFLYRDNLDFLTRAGCELRYFSPLRDRSLPEGSDLLLLCGGYPELYAKALAENTEMLTQVKEWVSDGRPCIAECGGFLYLHEELEDSEGRIWPMAGVFPGRGIRNRRLQNFGYIEMTAQKDGLLCGKGGKLRAHEFHYWSCEENGDAFVAVKPANGKSWKSAFSEQKLYAGFPHLYFYGFREQMLQLLKLAAGGQKVCNDE